MTPEEKVRNDEEYYYDTRTRDRDVRRSRGYFNWVPLLLIPLFFVLGWVTKGAYDASPQNGVTTPQFGVGGGPGNVTPYPQGYVATPKPAPVVEPSIVPDDEGDAMDEEVEDASPSPSVTPTRRSTPSGSPSPEV